MKQNKTREWKGVISIIILMIAISFSVTSIYTSIYYQKIEKIDKGIIEMNKLDKNIGYMVCIDSINSKEFLARDDRYGEFLIPLFNITQIVLDDLIERYPDGKIINSEFCLNYRTIYEN